MCCSSISIVNSVNNCRKLLRSKEYLIFKIRCSFWMLTLICILIEQVLWMWQNVEKINVDVCILRLWGENSIFTLLSEMMYHVAVLLPFPRILTTCEMVLECQRILGEKSTNVPRRHPVVFGFRFSFLCGLLCVLYRCWGTLLVCFRAFIYF